MRIIGIEYTIVLVQGTECLDGTPLLDIKPNRTLFTPIAPAQADDFQTGYHDCRCCGDRYPATLGHIVSLAEEPRRRPARDPAGAGLRSSGRVRLRRRRVLPVANEIEGVWPSNNVI